MVDMEEGVVSEVMKSPLRDVFDHQQQITDVSGSGNNWSVSPFLYRLIYKVSFLCRSTWCVIVVGVSQILLCGIGI